MKTKDLIEKYLEVEPRARERMNRARAIWNVLQKKYGFETIDKTTFIDLQPEIESASRYFRMIQEERPNLRGNDYDTKDIVEQRKEVELGYEAGYGKKLAI